jgi:hypothetical protein
MSVASFGWRWMTTRAARRSSSFRAAATIVLVLVYAVLLLWVFDLAYWLMARFSSDRVSQRVRSVLAAVVLVVVYAALSASAGSSPAPTASAAPGAPASLQQPTSPLAAGQTPAVTVSPNAPLSTGASSPSLAASIGQPLPGEPDPSLTPGALNPDVTQDNIQITICVTGWTDTIRPSADYTGTLEVAQIAEYEYEDVNPGDYEEDHLIPLELGGAPTDPRNLWPEPRTAALPDGREAGAETKDRFENQLHSEVCAGAMTLAEAQAMIGTQWVHYLYSIPLTASPTPSAATPSAAPSVSKAPFAVVLIDAPVSLARSEGTTFTAQTTEGAKCSIRVKLPSGANSTNASLKTIQTAGGNGLISWPWNVQSNTKPGKATVTVTCTLGGATKAASATFAITAS